MKNDIFEILTKSVYDTLRKYNDDNGTDIDFIPVKFDDDSLVILDNNTDTELGMISITKFN